MSVQPATPDTFTRFLELAAAEHAAGEGPGPICPLCRSPLEAGQAPRCGSCGSELRISLRTRSARIGLWIAALAVSAGGFGFGVFFVFLFTNFLIREGGPPGGVWGELIPLGVQFVTSGVSLACVLFLRHWYRARHIVWRIGLLSLVSAASIIPGMVFLVLIS